MGNIVLLDDLTINKIAAGEVIERPASVVKEIVENSIDAGADNISVEIKNGGISYIRITDNGKGFEADDLEIAFERHATSKIRNAEDLEIVKSMGFRGEALASIAAISRVELVTKNQNDEVGHKIVVEGGKIISKEEVGCPKGTTITIENLFFNTPVRYKFLKKDFTESGYIEDVITRIALVNTNISLKLVNSGKTVIQTSGNGEIKDVIYSIYGKNIAENIINVDYEFEDMFIKGVIGKPDIARSNRANQLFFVNKRYVKDKTLTSAAEQAFKGTLSVGKYGFLVLNIEMDPHKLDVNVHPAKLEVRFQEENKIFKLVYHAIKETLVKGNNIEQKSNNFDTESNRLNFEDRLKRFENKLSEVNENKKNNNSENKGFAGFFKNFMNNSKRDVKALENNLIEEVYNSKLKQEDNVVDESLKLVQKQENVNNILNTDENNSQVIEEISNNQVIEEKNNIDNLNNVINEDNKIEKFDNIIVKENGEILLKDFKVRDINMNKDFGIPDPNIDKSSNLEKLMKELNANLEILNIKPKTESEEIVKEEKIQEINLENEIDILNIDNNIKNYDLKEEIAKFNEMDRNIENEKNNDIKDEKEISNSIKDNTIFNNNEGMNKIDEINISSENNETYEKNNLNCEQEKGNNTEIEKNIESKENSDVNFEEMYAKMFGTNISSKSKSDEQAQYSFNEDDMKIAENVSLFTNKSTLFRPTYKFIGIIFNTYIIIEYEREMYVIEQTAANERILYEKIKNNYYNDSNKDSQLMLLPDIINLTHRQMGIAKDNMQLFRKAGFDLEEFGENTVKLSSVPSMCLELDTQQLFLDILEEINTVARTAKNEIEEKFIATVANRAAKKVKKVFTMEEVDNLLQELLVLQSPFIGSTGKPNAIKMSKIDIEKKFSRR